MKTQLNMFDPSEPIPNGNKERSFFNTPHLKGKELVVANAKALSKKLQVLEYFKQNPNKDFIPTEVSDALKMHESSVRRSCWQLSHEPEPETAPLEMLEKQRDSKYGVPNYCYQIKIQ